MIGYELDDVDPAAAAAAAAVAAVVCVIIADVLSADVARLREDKNKLVGVARQYAQDVKSKSAHVAQLTAKVSRQQLLRA